MLASGLLIRWITCLIIKDVLCLKVMLPGLDKDYRRVRAELYRLAGVNFSLHNGIFQEYVLAQKNNGTLF